MELYRQKHAKRYSQTWQGHSRFLIFKVFLTWFLIVRALPSQGLPAALTVLLISVLIGTCGLSLDASVSGLFPARKRSLQFLICI